MSLNEELNEVALTEQEAQRQFTHSIRVCTAAGCLSLQSDTVLKNIKEQVEAKGHEPTCQAKGVGCLGLCSAGPLIAVDAEGVEEELLYQRVLPDDAEELVESTGTNQPVERLLIDTSAPFFRRQHKIVLENFGFIDPERIEEYVAVEGYDALT
ncbi:MAG: NADH-quinone oxidoreductase subunit L, partial [Chloroflexi bacterium]|nr:NADH-quinone oxidoreductase subunit L [Chloroflexota bacterium]